VNLRSSEVQPCQSALIILHSMSA